MGKHAPGSHEGLNPYTGAFDRYPQEYEQRVLTFFDEMLVGDAGSAGRQP